MPKFDSPDDKDDDEECQDSAKNCSPELEILQRNVETSLLLHYLRFTVKTDLNFLVYVTWSFRIHVMTLLQ